MDRILFLAVIFLMTTGLLMSYSLSSYVTTLYNLPSYHFLIRQLFAVCVGIFLMVYLSRLDANRAFKPIMIGLFGSTLLLLLFMPIMPESIVPTIGGANRWMNLGFISLAPVEFYKVGFVSFISWSLVRTRLPKGILSFGEEFTVFIPYLLVFILSMIFIAIFQKDLGQTMLLAITLSILFLLVGSSFKFFFSLIGISGMFFIMLVIMQPYRLARIKSWLSSFNTEASRPETYQVSNSLDAIHSGGFFGQGIGNGSYKLGFLSEVHTDFVLAGMIEELGFISILSVVAVFAFMIFIIFKIASKVKNPIYYLFCVGTAMLLSLSFIINSFGISGIIPIKGIAVPFLSYGGSHIIASSIMIGIVLMIFKTIRQKEEL